MQPHRVLGAGAVASVGGVDRVGVGAEAGRAAPASSGSPSTHPHAGPLLGAGLGEQQRPSRRRRRQRASPPRGLADCFSSGSQPAALHEVDDEGQRRRTAAAGTCPAGRPASSGRPTASSGGGCAGLERGERERAGSRCSSAPAKSSVSRSAWAWISGSSGIAQRYVGVAADAGSKTASKARERVAGAAMSAVTSPPTRSRPPMKASCALSPSRRHCRAPSARVWAKVTLGASLAPRPARRSDRRSSAQVEGDRRARRTVGDHGLHHDGVGSPARSTATVSRRPSLEVRRSTRRLRYRPRLQPTSATTMLRCRPCTRSDGVRRCSTHAPGARPLAADGERPTTCST